MSAGGDMDLVVQAVDPAGRRARCDCGGYGVLLEWGKEPGPRGSTWKRLRCGRPGCSREWDVRVVVCACEECEQAKAEEVTWSR